MSTITSTYAQIANGWVTDHEATQCDTNEMKQIVATVAEMTGYGFDLQYDHQGRTAIVSLTDDDDRRMLLILEAVEIDEGNQFHVVVSFDTTTTTETDARDVLTEIVDAWWAS